MSFVTQFTSEFKDDTRFLRKEQGLSTRLEKKIVEIIENPEHFKPLRNVLKGKRRAHVGSYVILFEIINGTIIFLRFLPHDIVY